jgi:hypothetical protein
MPIVYIPGPDITLYGCVVFTHFMPRRKTQKQIYVRMNMVLSSNLVRRWITLILTVEFELFENRSHLIAFATVLVSKQHNKRVDPIR